MKDCIIKKFEKKTLLFMSSFAHNVKGLDFFAYPVTLTFRGIDKHKSFTGGCVTILIVLILLLYSSTTLFRLMF